MHLGTEIGFQSFTDFSCDLQDTVSHQKCAGQGTGSCRTHKVKTLNLIWPSSTSMSRQTKLVLLCRVHWLSGVLLWGSCGQDKTGAVRMWSRGVRAKRRQRWLKGQGLKSRWEQHCWHLCKRWHIPLRRRTEKSQGQWAARKDHFLHLRHLYVIHVQQFKSKQQIQSQSEKPSRSWHGVFLPWATIFQNTALWLAGGLKNTYSCPQLLCS